MMNADDLLLAKIQKAELYLLGCFDRVCREHSLVYFLDSGSALGAVRHGGFIPWDDDIDVGMPRKDYELFMQIGQRYLPNNIFLQNNKTENNYYRFAAKLRLIGTVFPEANDCPYEHNGIFIDIFPFDNIKGPRLRARLNVKIVVEMLHVIRIYRGHNSGTGSTRLSRLFSNIIRLMPQSFINRIEISCLKVTRRNENRATKYMTCYFWRMSQTRQYLFESQKMLPVKSIVFDGLEVMIMNNPHYYLSLMYGDYMKLPPEENRLPHRRGGVVLGDFDCS